MVVNEEDDSHPEKNQLDNHYSNDNRIHGNHT